MIWDRRCPLNPEAMRPEQQTVTLAEAIQLGLEHHQAGQLPEAERIYQQVLQLDPNNSEALHLLGVIAHQVGKNEIAAELIAKALTIQPEFSEALCNLGLALYTLKRYEEALVSFDKALTIKPDYAQVLRNRGLTLQKLQRSDEALASYNKTLTIKPDFAEALLNRGNVLRDLKHYAEALASYDKALKIKPESAEVLCSRGNALHDLKRYDEAIASYAKALTINADYAEALSNRGAALQELQHYEEALSSCEEALKINPDFAEALNNRGLALQKLKRYGEALASYDKALTIKPDYAEALSNRGLALQEHKRYDEALSNYDEALSIKPDYAEAHLNKSLCQLLIGEFERGCEEYEWRWKWDAFASARRNFSQPLWLGKEDISSKTILLHAEQGLGDTIQFARYAQAVAEKGAKVILEVQPALKFIMSGISGAHQVLSQGESLPDFDFHCPLLSLPLAFGTRLETIPARSPYLSVANNATSRWRKELAPSATRLVGLCWKGDPHYKRDRDRSMRLAQFGPLFDTPGVKFVSLQKELDDDERAITAGMENFVHPGANFKATAEMLGALDLVISVDTVWAHWAGALGKPLWILLSIFPHWCWLLDRNDSPWYPTAQLFRQTRFGDWEDVVTSVKHEMLRICQ